MGAFNVFLDKAEARFKRAAQENHARLFRCRITARSATGSTVANEDGKLVLQADVSSISRSCYDVESTTASTAIEGPTALTVSATIFNTLQTDWIEDTTGYSFQDSIPVAVFTGRGARTIRVVYTITIATVAHLLIVDCHVHNALP